MWAKNSGYDDFSQENMIFSDEITSQIYNSFGRNVVIWQCKNTFWLHVHICLAFSYINIKIVTVLH